MRLTVRLIFLVVFVSVVGSSAVEAQVRLTPDEAATLLLEAPEPVYPEIARVTQAKGLVAVEAVVSEQGTVISARATSGHPLLQASAVSAVKKRKYRAYLLSGKPTPFTTIINLVFPPGPITKEEIAENERNERLAQQYFQEQKKCRALAKKDYGPETERACEVVVKVADQLNDTRSLEKISASEFFGHVLARQKRYSEAIDYYRKALKIAAKRLTENDAELGELWGEMAIAHHLKRDLDLARQYYKKAEMIYDNAYATFGHGDNDEFVQETKRRYLKSLKTLLQFHLDAAQDAGASFEAEQISKRLKELN
jgi:TonB family protein